MNSHDDQSKARYYESHRLRPAVAGWYYRQLGPARRILDLGCGNGDFGRYRPAPEIEVHGIDVDGVAVASAARFEVAVQGDLDGTPLPYGDEFFDAVLARDIFEHLQAPWLALREARRVLRPGGVIVASVVMAKPQAVWADYTHVRGFTRSSVVLMFRDTDFEVEAVWQMGGVPLTSRLALIDQVPTLLRLPLIGRRWATSWEISSSATGSMTRPPHLLRRATRWIGRRRWIRFGVRNRLARLIHDPDRAIPEEFTVSFFGLRYVGNFASFIDWSVYYFGAYSEAELDLFGRILSVNGDGCCLDVGANVGSHTLFIAGHASSVIAFEPVPALAEQIRTRVAANHLRNVEVVQVGLGDIAEDLPFFASTDHNQGTGTFVAGVFERPAQVLHVQPGDETLAERGEPPVILAKIDVEGFEPDVLRGLRGTLDRCRPIVFFEWSTMSVDRAGGLDPGAYFPAGYSLFSFEPQIVWLWVLTRARFAVKPWRLGSQTSGNLLAIPVEHLGRLSVALGIKQHARPDPPD